MAITRTPRAVRFTAVNDGIDLGEMVDVVGMSFQGTGLTASQRLEVRDSATVGGGSPLADYITEGTADNADLWVSRKSQTVSGLSVSNNTVAGTWVLTVFINR
jgi:uncharacterized protein (UPF0303 family)